jgi:hypothetical protein
MQNGSSPVDHKGYRLVDGNMVNKMGHVFAPRGLLVSSSYAQRERRIPSAGHHGCPSGQALRDC